MKEFSESKNDPLGELMHILGKLPKQKITMLNLPRYAQAIDSVKKIVGFVKEDYPDAKVKLYFDELTGTSLCLEIVAEEFNIYKIKEFCDAVITADTMCVVPRTDNMVNVGFTFEGSQIPMPPIEK